MSEQATKLYVTITRVDGPLYDGEALSVSVPGVDGDMTILARHEALISPIRKGTISVKKLDETVESFEVEAGTLEVSNNQATILL